MGVSLIWRLITHAKFAFLDILNQIDIGQYIVIVVTGGACWMWFETSRGRWIFLATQEFWRTRFSSFWSHHHSNCGYRRPRLRATKSLFGYSSKMCYLHSWCLWIFTGDILSVFIKMLVVVVAVMVRTRGLRKWVLCIPAPSVSDVPRLISIRVLSSHYIMAASREKGTLSLGFDIWLADSI